MITRRGLLGVLGGAIAAPLIVHSGLIMPVKRPNVLLRPIVFQVHYQRYSGWDVLNLNHSNEIARWEITESDLRRAA